MSELLKRLGLQRIEWKSSEKCPWCRQWKGGGFEVWERDPFVDHYTCANCGGTSLWRWEMCMIYIGALQPPEPAWPNAAYYDVENARLRTQATLLSKEGDDRG
jgi:hypothetical protein